jgi:hypothetical protein
VRIIERRLALRWRRCSAWLARFLAEGEFAKVYSRLGFEKQARIIFTELRAVNPK